jgi:hypothetical protein
MVLPALTQWFFFPCFRRQKQELKITHAIYYPGGNQSSQNATECLSSYKPKTTLQMKRTRGPLSKHHNSTGSVTGDAKGMVVLPYSMTD